MKLLFLVFICITCSYGHEDYPFADISTPEEEYGWISNLADLIRRLLEKKDNPGKQCFEKKAKGIVPSAENKDSPIEVFGFPFFNEVSKSILLKAGTPLSYMFGKRQPIRIGSRDYIISGYANELQAFFDCFDKYAVIGSSLNQDGRWVSNTGTIKLQINNVDEHSTGLDSSLFDMLFKISLDRIIKYLQPTKIIKRMDAIILGSSKAASSKSEISKALDKIKEWLPGSDVFIKKFKEIFAKDISLKEKIKEFMKFVKDFQHRRSFIRKNWVGWDNVNKRKKLIVTLTMYAKPENRLRSTYDAGKATVMMGDLSKAFKIFLNKH